MLYRRWTLHGFGHMLGLDVHDCARARAENYRDGPLREGYVLTVEPGLYFQPDDELVPAELRGDRRPHRGRSRRDRGRSPHPVRGLPTRADDVETWLAAQREAGPRTPTARIPDDEPAAPLKVGRWPRPWPAGRTRTPPAAPMPRSGRHGPGSLQCTMFVNRRAAQRREGRGTSRGNTVHPVGTSIVDPTIPAASGANHRATSAMLSQYSRVEETAVPLSQ